MIMLYSGRGCPLVSTPKGSKTRPRKNASEVNATGVPIVPIEETPAPTRKVMPAPIKRPDGVANPKALARHSVRYCSGSHNEYIAKFAPPTPWKNRMVRNQGSAAFVL